MHDEDEIEAAIQAIEAQRDVLGAAVVELALAPLREKLAALRHGPAGRDTSAPGQQLRQVTVLFVDLVDSTAMDCVSPAELAPV